MHAYTRTYSVSHTKMNAMHGAWSRIRKQVLYREADNLKIEAFWKWFRKMENQLGVYSLGLK